MKTVKLEVPLDTARHVLSDYERKISERIRTRNELTSEITKLEELAKALRIQLQDHNGEPEKSGQGDNKTRIKEYLSKVADNKGARMAEIHRATGIGNSSVAFTLKHYKNDFIVDEDTKQWRLK